MAKSVARKPASAISRSTRKNAAAKKNGKGNSAGRPTPDELERRMKRVLEVATEMFIDRGYAATSLVDIAKAAGVATRTIYFRFGNKEDLFREVIYARDSGGAVEQPKVHPGDTLFSALSRACAYDFAVTSRPQSIGLMRLMIAESSRFPEFMSSIANSIFARFERNVEKVFIQLEQSGLIPRGNHARSAELFNDLVLGSHPIMIYTRWNAEMPSDEDLAERVEIFIKGRFGPATWKTAKTRKARLPKSAG